MIPIVIDPEMVPVALVGRGELAVKRLEWLLAAGAVRLTVFSDRASPALESLAGGHFAPRLPTPGDLRRYGVIWIADLPGDEAAPLVETARASGALVNLEDVKPSCDFHNPAVVRRGDLLISVSTGGRSPGLAARIRRFLEGVFGPEWTGRTERIGTRRDAWRRRERPLEELAELSDAMIDHHGWLPATRGRNNWPAGPEG